MGYIEDRKECSSVNILITLFPVKEPSDHRYGGIFNSYSLFTLYRVDIINIRWSSCGVEDISNCKMLINNGINKLGTR